MNRIKQMKQLRKKRLSYGTIGKLFGISRQRVHQLISGYVPPVNRRKIIKYRWLNKLFDAIFERDNYKCQSCNKEKATLVHHIDKNNFNNDPTNLVSLCNKCHLALHGRNKGGISVGKNRKEYMRNYLKKYYKQNKKKNC